MTVSCLVQRSSNHARARARLSEGDGERGSGTVEFVIGAVLMVFLLLAVVQIALYFHLKSVANTAARHGVDRVRVIDGTAEAGIIATNEFLDQAGGSLEDRNVEAARSTELSSVTVTGQVVAVIPGLSMQVSVTANAPTERYVP